MFKQRRALTLGLAGAATLLAMSTASVSAAPNYYWAQEGTPITTNAEVKLEKAPESVYRLRTTVLGLAGVIECESIAINHGIVVDGKTRGNFTIGRQEGEVVLSNKCKTSICTTVKEPIKILPTGVGQGVNLADKSEAGTTTKVYDTLLPNSALEFMTVTLEGGTCGASTSFKVTTPLTRRGFGEEKEGESGLMGEIDKSKAGGETESLSHELTFTCAGTSQEPKKAFDGDGEEVNVDSLRVVLGLETNSACLEGRAVLRLVNGKRFSVK